MTPSPAAASRWLDGPWRLAAVSMLLGLPFVGRGYGTDIDIPGLLASGAAIRAGHYVVSRTPGAPVHEAAVGILDAIGGHVAVNVATLAVATLAVTALARLVRATGARHGGLVALVLVVNPVWWIAATSTVDFCWAVAGLLLGMEQLRAKRVVPAAVFFALACGCRASTVVLVVAILAAHAIGARARDRRLVLRVGALWGAATMVVFLPPVLTLGTEMGASSATWSGFATQLGRFAVKNVLVVGLAGAVLLAVALSRALPVLGRRWRRDAIARSAVLGTIAAEALFFVLPWKLGHLLPALALGLLGLGVSRRVGPTLLVVLVASQLAHGAIGVSLVRPDTPDAATSGRFDPVIGAGPLVNDLRCRADFPRGGDEAWACSLSWWRGTTAPDPEALSDRGAAGVGSR